ncbi:AMP-binding protein [Paraburkholderia solisilvae]|nr:AMP-binding protein [Paraburkholderia solisilvae]
MNSPTPHPRLQHAHWLPDTSNPVFEQTVGDTLRRAAGVFAGNIALVEGHAQRHARRAWTYSELLSASERLAHGLLQRFRPGEHVAVWGNSSPDWLLLELGAALAGLVLVTVNPAFREAELAYVLEQSRAVGCFAVPHYRERDMLATLAGVRAGLPALREVAALDDLPYASADDSAAARLPAVKPDDIAQIQYTSGTTGFPKGAMLHHRGLVNNARFYAQATGARERDVWINPLPMFHTAGCGLVTLGSLQTGGTHVMLPGFDAGLMLELLESERGSITLSVPTMAIALLEHPALATHDLSEWRIAALGGAPVTTELAERIERTVPARVTVGFGLTEHSPYITHSRPDEPFERRALTVGRPLPNTEVKVVDPHTGAIVPIGEVGEICVRSYAVMRGYFEQPEATAAALDPQGWLRTGDLGSMDADGYCSIRGRLKDVIIRGGENIYPREIEDVLVMHAGVADAAVVGTPDDTWGEVVVAFIRTAAGVQLNETELFDHCRRHLAPFKTPRHWRFVDSFPQTPSGKIQKYVLRDWFAGNA